MGSVQSTLLETEHPFEPLDSFFETKYVNKPLVIKSVAKSEYFQDVAWRMERVLPDKLVQRLELSSHTETRHSQIREMTKDIFALESKERMVTFLETYIAKMPATDKKDSKFISYLADKDAFCKDLDEATHLDVKDMVKSLQKGVLGELLKLVQQSKSDVTHMDDVCIAVVKKFTSYEWVSKLTCVQAEIKRFIKIRKERLLTHDEILDLNRLIGIEQSLEDYSSIEKVLELLQCYGVIEFDPPLEQKDMYESGVIAIKAASLSLENLLNTHEDLFKLASEIHILCFDCFYIDTSTNGVCNGKNIALKVPKIIVKNEGCCIDVSGENGTPGSEDDKRASSGDKPGECGSRGEDGTPGQSGGNIFICTDEIVHSSPKGKLTLRSNGGNGGKGQDGGHGKDGKAVLSTSDNLEDFPKHFLSRNFITDPFAKGIPEIMEKIGAKCKGNVTSGTYFPAQNLLFYRYFRSISLYGEAPNGVQYLFSSVDYNSFGFNGGDYGFLLSKSKDGLSADGGKAGTGGKGGGGGKAGNIELRTMNDFPYNPKEGVKRESKKGADGTPGKTGKGGKKALAVREPDYLYIDAFGFGTNKQYGKEEGLVIDVKPWSKRSKSQLGNGPYYCVQSVSKEFDSTIDDGEIGFFKDEENSLNLLEFCPTKDNRPAEDGLAIEQHQIIRTTETRPINRLAVNLQYQLFTNEKQISTNHAALLQSLEQLEHALTEKLQELETISVKQQHKQLRQKNQSSSNLANVTDIKAVVKGALVEPDIPYDIDELISMGGNVNPWVSQSDVECFQSKTVSISDKYNRIIELIENQLKTLQQKGKSGTESLLGFPESCYLYQMLDIILHPIVLVIRYEDKEMIKRLNVLLDAARSKISSEFGDRLNTLKGKIDPLLLKKYRQCMLTEVHHKLLSSTSCADPEFQLKAVTVHRKICEQTSIKELDKYNRCHSAGLIVDPYRKPLPVFETSCSTTVRLPLSQNTMKALELLTVYINEVNKAGVVYVPDILLAVQDEHKMFHRTISDSELLFVITYIQETLGHVLDKACLEDLFCDGLLSKVGHGQNSLQGECYISYKGKTYQVGKVERSEDVINVTISQKVSEESQNEFSIKNDPNGIVEAEPQAHFLKLYPDRVTLDDQLVNFPNDVLLVSSIDISQVWLQLQKSVLENGRIPNNGVLREKVNKLSLPSDEHKNKLVAILEQCRLAQEIPYDVLSYYPPSQWLEQLILNAVRQKYQEHGLPFIVDIKKAIRGLSQCVDKSLYCSFFTQFLQASKENYYRNVDILKALQSMKSVCIDNQVCSLVTPQAISHAAQQCAHDQLSPKAIFSDLKETGIIDETGAFSSDVTGDTIKYFCKTHNLEHFHFHLNAIYTVQQYFHDLSNKGLSFWCHRIHELQLRLNLQNMTEEDINDDKHVRACDDLLTYVHQLERQYGDDKVSEFITSLSSKNEKVAVSLLRDSFEKCATREWIFEFVIGRIQSTESLVKTLKDLDTHSWESEQSKEQTVVEIIKYIKSNLKLTKDTAHLPGKLDNIVNKVNEIKGFFTKRKVSQLPKLLYRKSSNPAEADRQEKKINGWKYICICDYQEEHIEKWICAFKNLPVHEKPTTFSHAYFAETFAVIQRGVTLFYERVKGIEHVPRDTQMVASLLFCQDLSEQGGASQGVHLMQQISTGEGKTIILCMTAIFKALLGEKVDIVTSSSVLAIRDATEQKELYTMFGISVAHCCHQGLLRRRKAYEADVIYGDIGSFQRDILETEFYGQVIRTDHPYNNVFVDEVDSMLIDKGENMLYLPHALPDMNALEQIYLEIWTLVNAQDFLGFPDEQNHVYYHLKHKIFGGIRPSAFSAIPNVTVEQSKDIHHCCIKNGLLSQDDHCFTVKMMSLFSIAKEVDKVKNAISTIDSQESNVLSYLNSIANDICTVGAVSPSRRKEVLPSIQGYLNSIVAMPKEHRKDVTKIVQQFIFNAIEGVSPNLQQDVLLILQEHVEKKTLLETIPKLLHQFIEKSLKSWIHSAVSAKYLQPNKEYIIDIDRQESASDRYPKIIIMDNDTGVEQESSEWGSGLHQFLQLKHNLRLSTESLKAVYMSNITFFTYYDNVMGVTGTMGSIEEHALFNKLYENTLIVVLPTNKPSQLRIETPICCPTTDSWEAAIVKDIQEKFQKGRAVLLICQDVERARHLHQCMLRLNPELYISSRQEKLQEMDHCQPSRLIISTNLAGRGTDIKLSPKVKDNGGLHVCLSYLPPNVRVELQAYGRAARSGNPGSCKMIFHDKEELNYAIRNRDLCEAHRVTDIEVDYDHNIRFQEELFKNFRTLYNDIMSEHENNPEERPKLDHCLDCWAYFLDRYTDKIESIPKLSTNVARLAEKARIREAFEKEVKAEILKEKMDLSAARLKQLGHSFMKQAVRHRGKYKDVGNEVNDKKALEAYEKAIAQNPNDLFAMYYAAAAQLNLAYRNKNTTLEGTPLDISKLLGREDHRSTLKQKFYKLIPLFQDRLKQCHMQITMLRLANRHQDQSLTGGVLYYDEQKQHELEVYHHFIATMQDVIGKDLSHSSFDHADWGEKGAKVVYKIVKEKFSLKECRVARKYKTRLEELLKTKTSMYYTFESRVRNKIKSLERPPKEVAQSKSQLTPLTKDDFKGLMPDKNHFWAQLKKHHLITTKVKVDTPQEKHTAEEEEEAAYWNPAMVVKDVQLDDWDCINAHSFDWISGLSHSDKEYIVSHLIKSNVLNHKGQLIGLDLTKPLDLPESYSLFYRAIKDTLWNQSIYRFILMHLSDGVHIDLKHDIDQDSDEMTHQASDSETVSTTDNSCYKAVKNFISRLIWGQILDITLTGDIDDADDTCTEYSDIERENVPPKTSNSVIDILISMNPNPNHTSAVSSIDNIEHIQAPITVNPHSQLTESKSVDTNSVRMEGHVPNEALNQKFIQQLQQRYLRYTHVSESGLNCLINACVQHAKHEYHTMCFKEAEEIQKRVLKQYPEVTSDLTGMMLHCDEKYVEEILHLVNEICQSDIKTVSMVIASNNGPVIYGDITDKLLTSGRHVVIWQQGNHFSSIVHHLDMVKATIPPKSTCTDQDAKIRMKKPQVHKLTMQQLGQLEQMQIIKKSKHGRYEICVCIGEIESILDSEKVSQRDMDDILAFFCSKLEIDFKTLNNSPRQLVRDQHQVLFDDLCQYSVIKPVKIKSKADNIKEALNAKFGQKSLVPGDDKGPYFDRKILEDYLSLSEKKLDESQYKKVESHLYEESVVTTQIHKVETVKRAIGPYNPIENVERAFGQHNIDPIPLIWHKVNKDKLCKLKASSDDQSIIITQEMKDALHLMINLKENRETIISTLIKHQSTILDLETPEITLHKLSDVFDDSIQAKGDVLGWFSDNQCAYIIDLGEQKWSWKTITTAVGAIALGVAQITLGAVLLVYSAGTLSFVSSGLISEGVSDMIFGLEGLAKGHCNWSQYWENKKMSLMITCATAGLGAWLSGGKEASKYTFKAFGTATREAAETAAKELGKDLSREIGKQVAKEIGKEVSGAVVNAGISIAIDKLLEKMSDAINILSEKIINSFSEICCKDGRLEEAMRKYLKQEDPEHAAKYLHQISERVLNKHGEIVAIVDDINSKALKATDVVTKAHAKATEHLQMCGGTVMGQGFMKLVNVGARVAPLVSEVLKSAMIPQSMSKLKSDLINELEDSEHEVVQKHTKIPLDDKAIEKVCKEEIAAIKKHFRQELSQRGTSIIKWGLQELQKVANDFGKDYLVNPLKDDLAHRQLDRYEQKLQLAKTDRNYSQIRIYETKMKVMMVRTRNPAILARMIEKHDACLGPFAAPVLEKLIKRPIEIENEAGVQILPRKNDALEPGINPIKIKLIIGPGGQPFFVVTGNGESKDGKTFENMIDAVIEANGPKGIPDIHSVRRHVAAACLDPEHPCHDYVKQGVANKYYMLGVQ